MPDFVDDDLSFGPDLVPTRVVSDADDANFFRSEHINDLRRACESLREHLGDIATPTISVPVPPYSTGIHGALTYDGVSTVLGVAPSAGVYTLTEDPLPTDVTINAGVEVIANGYGIFATGTATINGKFTSNGSNGTASGAAGAGALGVGRFGPGAAGGGQNSSGSGSSNPLIGYTSGGTAAAGTTGSHGGNGSDGPCPFAGGAAGSAFNAGGNGGSVSTPNPINAGSTITQEILKGKNPSGTKWTWGSGGGGGRGASGYGRGGGGGGIAVVSCATLAGAGSIEAKGGAGGTATEAGASGGGGGGGGVALAIYGTRTGSVTITAAGGTGGLAGPPSGSDVGGAGGAGAAGHALALNISGDGT